MAYDLLVRIADGLAIPRGYMGLAYDSTTVELADDQTSHPAQPSNEHEEVRQLLSHAAEVTVGAAVTDVGSWSQPVERASTPVPRRIGFADVAQLEAITAC